MNMNATAKAINLYLIIGSGRVARHLAHYFNHLNLNYITWDRAQDPHLLANKISEAQTVLLAISDAALEGFYRRHLAGHDKTVVHFSGAKDIPGTISAHPLMTFSEELYPVETYRKMHFTLTGASSLSEALPGLQNSFSILRAEDKALYHALCVSGGNFVTLLIAEMVQGLTKLQIPKEAVATYSKQILDNALTQSTTALTGPIARKDAETVEMNLKALQGTSLEPIYQSFLKAYWPEFKPQLLKERIP